MLIWLMVLLLLAGFAALGYAKGAIRMIFPLVGLFVGALLALPLAPLARPLIPLVGLKNPVWSALLPPVVVFFLLALLLIGVGFLVHWKLGLHFKYRTDDLSYQRWLRLNQRVGVCIGLVAGVVYSLLIGVIVYVFGYLTVQVSAGDNDTALVRYLNKAREDLRSSGLESAVAVMDPAPERYYQAADVLGLLYHNSLLHSRLASYPPFLILAERPEFQEVANDSAYQNMLATQASVSQILQDPKTQAILANEGLLDELRQIDLKDLHAYLKTGVSEKYIDHPILGRWEVDAYATMLQEKRRRLQMTAEEMLVLKTQVELLKGLRLIIAPDNSVKLKGPDVSDLLKKVAELGIQTRTRAPAAPPPAATAAPAAPAPGSYDSVMVERYGVRPGGGTATPSQPRGANPYSASRLAAPATQRPGSSVAQRPGAPTPARPIAAPRPGAAPQAAPANTPPAPLTPKAVEEDMAKLPTSLLAQGTWNDEGGRYSVALHPDKDFYLIGGKDKTPLQGVIRDGTLYLTRGRQTLVLERF